MKKTVFRQIDFYAPPTDFDSATRRCSPSPPWPRSPPAGVRFTLFARARGIHAARPRRLEPPARVLVEHPTDTTCQRRRSYLLTYSSRDSRPPTTFDGVTRQKRKLYGTRSAGARSLWMRLNGFESRKRTALMSGYRRGAYKYFFCFPVESLVIVVLIVRKSPIVLRITRNYRGSPEDDSCVRGVSCSRKTGDTPDEKVSRWRFVR